MSMHSRHEREERSQPDVLPLHAPGTMESHIEDVVPTEDLAASVGLSRRQLERLFTEEMKTSPGAVYTRIRMERAKQLVLQTEAPLIEIALEVGFDSASHFARLFRRLYGQSPTELRRAHA